MPRHHRLLSMALAAFLLVPSIARALGPSADVYLGYTRMGDKNFNSTAGSQSGIQLAGHLKLMPFVGAEVDYSHFGLSGAASIPHSTVIMGGPRVTFGAGSAKLFLHGLAGWEHSGSGDGLIKAGALTFAMGGGADFKIKPHIFWRVTADYLGAPQSAPAGATHTRFGTGVVLRF